MGRDECGKRRLGGKWEIEKRGVCHRRGTKACDPRFMGTKGTARVGTAEKNTVQMGSDMQRRLKAENGRKEKRCL